MQNQTSHKQNFFNCSGETWKQETHQSLALATRELPSPRHFRNLCVPQAPTTSAPPPPTCPASPRDRLSCSPRRACRDVAVPVGTLCLPRLGGAALLPGGSRWSAKVVKHEESPGSGPMGHGKGRISQQRPQFLDYSENILFQALVKHSLNLGDAKKHQCIQFTPSVCSHWWPALTKQPWRDHG